MRKLTQTRLFRLLDGTEGVFNPAEMDLQPVYDDFVQSVIALCGSTQDATPAYFTLHYTRLELQDYRSVINEGAGEK